MIAVEAPSFGGKSTLLANINDKRLVNIPEACDFVGGNKNFPKLPFSNLRDAKANAHFFVAVEVQRQAEAKRAEDKGEIAILDRCSAISCVVLQRFIRDSVPGFHNFTGAYDATVEIFANAIAQNLITLPNLIVRISTDQTTFNQRIVRGTGIPAFKKWENFLNIQRIYGDALRVYPDSQLLFLISNNHTATTLNNLRKLSLFAQNKAVSNPDYLEMFEFTKQTNAREGIEASVVAREKMLKAKSEYIKIVEGICVRRGDAKDASKFKEVMLFTLKNEWGFDYDPVLNEDLNDPIKYYNGRGAFFVLEVNGKIVGTMALKDEGRTAYWKRLAILSEHRGGKYASSMLELMEIYTRTNGFAFAKFDTLKESGMYLAYQRKGFIIQSEESEGQFTKLVMQKEL